MFPNTQKEMTNSEKVNNLPFEVGDLIAPIETDECVYLVKGLNLHRFGKNVSRLYLDLQILHHNDFELVGTDFTDSIAIEAANGSRWTRFPYAKLNG